MNKDQTITLQPLAMRIPNSKGIYQPSKLRSQIEMDYKRFVNLYTDSPITMKVNFNPNATWETLERNSEEITAYGYALDCWYMVVGEVEIPAKAKVKSDTLPVVSLDIG